MKWYKSLWGLVIFLVVEGLLSGVITQAAPAGAVVTLDVVRNGFALGVNNDYCPQEHDPAKEPLSSAEWTYDEFVSLSKCGPSKNSDPYDIEGGGAMFKNGPMENSGLGLPGVPAHMWQVYDLVALGVPLDTPVTVDLTLELVSVGGTSFTAVLESSNDGVVWTPEATLIQWPQDACGEWKYPLYCGTAVVDYAPYYRLALASIWVDTLGQKWVIHHLDFTFESDTVVLPTATATAEPTLTVTPTPTVTPQPVFTPTPTPTAVVIPAFTVEDIILQEGDNGTQNAVFVVVLSSPLNQSIVLNFETVAETAVADIDFLAQNGSLTFAAEEVSKVVTIPVFGDTIFETDETFCLEVSYDGSSSAPVRVMARAYILNDDKVNGTEGDTVTVFLPFLTSTK